MLSEIKTQINESFVHQSLSTEISNNIYNVDLSKQFTANLPK